MIYSFQNLNKNIDKDTGKINDFSSFAQSLEEIVEQQELEIDRMEDYLKKFVFQLFKNRLYKVPVATNAIKLCTNFFNRTKYFYY